MSLSEIELKAMKMADNEFLSNRKKTWSTIYLRILAELKAEEDKNSKDHECLNEKNCISNIKNDVLKYFEARIKRLKICQGFKKTNVKISEIHYKSIQISKDKYGELRIVLKYVQEDK